MPVTLPTLHASCVRVGDVGVLIRGASGAGKSHLAFALILAGRAGIVAPTLLVADDRVLVEAGPAGLVASPPGMLAGLIEIRGLGIRRLDFAAGATIGLVVDLASEDGARLPQPEALSTVIEGVTVLRLPVAAGFDALQPVIGWLTTRAFMS